jgi:repressor LexA
MYDKETMLSVFGKRIKELRRINKYTVRELAEKVGISSSNISEYEAGNVMPSMYVLYALSEVLNVDMDYLSGKTNMKFNRKNNQATNKKIPVYSSASCGDGTQPLSTPIGEKPKPPNADGDYWVIAKGDSMKPKIFDGDELLVKSTQNVNNHDIVIVLHDGEVLCKIFYDSDKAVVLVSENKEFPNITLLKTEANNQIMGKVTYIGSKVF